MTDTPDVKAAAELAKRLRQRPAIDLIRNEYDPCPDLGMAAYKAFEDSWDAGVGRIADTILASVPDQGEAVAVPRFAVENVVKFLEAKRPGQQRETLFPIGTLNLLVGLLAAAPPIQTPASVPVQGVAALSPPTKKDGNT